MATPTDSVYNFLKLGNRRYLHSVKASPNGQILTPDAANPNAARAEGKLNATGLSSTKDYLFVTPNGPEFGAVKDSVECMALYEMDAFNHVKERTKYPAVLCVGGMNDPRVTGWQPGKLAAAMQTATASGRPVLMQVNYDNGHFTEDKKVTFRNFANMYAFGLWQAGHPDFQPKVVVRK